MTMATTTKTAETMTVADVVAMTGTGSGGFKLGFTQDTSAAAAVSGGTFRPWAIKCSARGRIGGGRWTRVALNGEEGVRVFAFVGWEVDFEVTFSASTPAAVVQAAIRAASEVR